MKLQKLANRILEVGELMASAAFAIFAGLFFALAIAGVMIIVGYLGMDTIRNLF